MYVKNDDKGVRRLCLQIPNCTTLSRKADYKYPEHLLCVFVLGIGSHVISEDNLELTILCLYRPVLGLQACAAMTDLYGVEDHLRA